MPLLRTITGLFEGNEVLLSLLGGLSLLMFIGSLIAVPLVIIGLVLIQVIQGRRRV